VETERLKEEYSGKRYPYCCKCGVKTEYGFVCCSMYWCRGCSTAHYVGSHPNNATAQEARQHAAGKEAGRGD
jgi:hypothetical protein